MLSYDFFFITTNKSSWEKLEIYFHGSQKSKKRKKKYLKKIDIIDSTLVNPQYIFFIMHKIKNRWKKLFLTCDSFLISNWL